MNDTLEHYGVKGMRWGIRKTKIVKSLNKHKQKRKALKKSLKASKKTDAMWKNKYYNRSNLSDEDLKNATKRLKLENELAAQIRKSAENRPKKVSRISKITSNVDKTTNDIIRTKKSLTKLAGLGAAGVTLAYKHRNKIPEASKIIFKTAKKVAGATMY